MVLLTLLAVKGLYNLFLCLYLFVCFSVPPTVYNIKNMTQSEGLSTTLVCLSWGDPAPVMTYRKEGHAEDYALGSNVIFLLQNYSTGISNSSLMCVFSK